MTVLAGAKASAADPEVNRPYVHVHQLVLTALTLNVARSLPFTGTTADTHNWHDPAVNNTRITPNIAGTYSVQGHLAVVGGTAADLIAEVRKNGVVTVGCPYSYQRATNQGFASNTVDCHGTVVMNGTTDYVELWVTSSASINTDVPTNDSQSHLVLRYEHS